MRMSEKTSDQSQIKGGSSPSHGSSEQLAKDPQVNGHESAKEDGDKDLKGNVKETPQGNVHDGQGDWQDKMNEAESGSGQKVPRGNGAGDSHSNGDPAGLDGADSKVSSACLDHGESPTKTKAVKENVVSHGKASATKGLSNGNSGKTGKSSSEKSLPLEVSTPVEPGFSLETSPRSHRNRHREGRGEGTQKVHSPRGYPPHPPHAQGPQHTHPPAQGPQAPPHQTPPHHHQSDPSASPRGGHSPSGHSPRSTSRGGSPQRENGATGTMSTGAPVPPSSSAAMAGGTGTVPAGTSLSSGSGQQGLTLGPGQHVVHVHVNPGETFSVRVGDQIQHIQGPATVRMVSQNGPPMPMPMQVPPGHIVQQIVDENGILTHVILSPQPPPGMTPAPSISSGPSGGPPQYYSTYPPYAGYTAAHAMGGAPAPHHPGTPSHQCNSSHTHGPQGSLPPHPNHSSQVDDRTQRMKERLQRKVHTRRKNINCFNNYSPSRTKVNGDLRRHDAHSSSSSNDGNEGDEEARTIQDILSRMKEPKVSNIDSRSALIEVIPPDCSQIELDLEINPAEFRYELFLSDKSKDGKYKMVYCGDATEITLKDLKPATDYFVRISSLLDDLKGEPTTPVNFRTSVCEPETPEKPKLSGRTKTSITLKWNAVNDNGAKISSYCLEFDQGKGNGRFVEAYNNVQRQFKVSKLTPATAYVFRLAAVNSVGKSDYSEPVCYCTSGSVPTQPDPPMLSEQFVTALIVSWIRRPNDDEFTLHMEDELSGHGFIPIFNGPDLSFKVCNLRRNTEYKFKLCARNEEGSSKFSDVVNYRTLPDRPGPCGRPQTKGKVHSNSFRVVWDHPKDNGGSEVTKYILEMDEGRGFEEVYEGPDREHTCDNLHPGHVYRLRTAAVNAGGRSPWSEMSSVTTQAVAPGLCQAPKLQGKPKATYLHLRWAYPDYDGGAEVIEYEVQMIQPDNSIREVYKGHDLDCMVAGLLPGRPYLYQVRATNKAGTGPWSDPLEVVSGPGAPDAPKTPTAVCRSPQSAIVSWEEPVNNGATITEYRLEWQQKPEADFTQLYNGSALNYEVRGLSPATLYSFRVQASNAAGTGPFSPQGACMTPSSSPSAVMSIRATSTAETITLSWKEPCCNGSEILSYNIDLGEKQHMVTVENVLEHTVHNLMPETLYKVRVQAVNSIGVGPFSQVVKVITRALPPTPPRLECVNCGPNSLKLKWGDGKNLDLIQYSLEMARDGGSFYPAYKGTSHSYKVSRLSELTSYRFRLYASNEAGDGPYSQVYTFITTKAPPPAVRAPSVLDLSLDSCRVEWHPCKPLGGDSISYILQLQTPYAKDQEYKQIYHGAETSCRLTSLSAKTEYQVRVCAVRECQGEAGPLQGAFSPGILFSTLSPEPVSKVASKASTEKKALVSLENRELTDHQKAMIILFGFAVFAIIIAIIVHRIFMYYKQ